MATFLVNQKTNVWSIASTGGAAALPILLCNYDLIPHRIRWEDTAATAGNQAIIQDAQGNVVYWEIETEAASEYSFVEQRPSNVEKWIGYQSPQAPAGPNGGITITRLDSGVLLIYL